MDPVLKIWMFQNWQVDQKEQIELAKNHAYLIGSFTNPDAVKELLDSGNKFTSTEDDFEESSKMVREQTFSILSKNPILTQNKEVRKRKRRIIKD
jgi:hypothetical protein